MPTLIFVNLPVSDLERSKSFYTALGFEINPQFTDENAACIVISDTIFVMLLVKSFFSNFTSKQLADTSTTAAAINALSADSREGVDALADKAIAAGGAQSNDPQDMDFMYSRSFEDPDGNLWEIVWMDPATIE